MSRLHIEQAIRECDSVGCARAAKTRGYCDRHYRRRLHTGRYGYRDAGPAREHITRLRELGWTWDGIAKAAGLSSWVAHKINAGATRRILDESERALLSLPAVEFESHRGVSTIGPRRRVRALAWMGWPNHEVARRIGCSPRTLPTELSRGRISTRLAQRIAKLYDELALTPGPSKHAAAKARLYGWAPPLAWDDETIDDPTARPATDDEQSPEFDEVAVERAIAGDPPRPLRKADRQEAVRRMTAAGLSAAQIGGRLGKAARSITRDRSASREDTAA